MKDLVDYKEKYLKYKLKYLKLQSELKQVGITTPKESNFGQTFELAQKGGELTQADYEQKYYKYKAKYYQLVEFIEQNGGQGYLSKAWQATKSLASAAAKGASSAVSAVANSAQLTVSQLSGKNAKRVYEIIQKNPTAFGFLKESDIETANKRLDELEKDTNLTTDVQELKKILSSCRNYSTSTKYDNKKCFEAPAQTNTTGATAFSAAAHIATA